MSRVIPFEADRHTLPARARAARFWVARARAEQAAVATHADLAASLVEASADDATIAAALRMARQALVHARRSASIARTLGELGDARDAHDGDALTPRSPLARAHTHEAVGARQRALRCVVDAACVRATVDVAILVESLARTTEPFVRAALRRILADKVFYPRFGLCQLELARGYLAEHPHARAALGEHLAVVFAAVAEDIEGGGARRGASPAPPGACALGVVEPRRAREIFYETIEVDVVPALAELGIPAARAWAARSLGVAAPHARLAFLP